MIDGRSELVKHILEKGDLEYKSAQRLCFSLVYTPSQVPNFSWSPSKVDFIYTWANLKVPLSLLPQSDEEQAEIVW